MKMSKLLPLFLLIAVLFASCSHYKHRQVRVKKNKSTLISTTTTSDGLISKPKHYKFGNNNIGIENKDNFDNMVNSREDAHFVKNYASEEALYASKEQKVIGILDQIKKENAIKENLEKPYFIIEMVDDSCDNIILKDGSEISGITEEVGNTEIRYKKCSNLSGPTFTINKSEVLMIKYRNGTKDIITHKSVEADSSVKEKKTIDEGKSVRVFGWIIWGVGILVILAVSIALGLLLSGLGALLIFVGRKK
jgi:hypothetical protein